MSLWSYNRLFFLARIDGKGLFKWFIFMLLFSGVIMRMKSSISVDGSINMDIVFLPYAIMICCYLLYNAFCNMPQITKMFPVTSKDEVKYSIIFLIKMIAGLFIFWGAISVLSHLWIVLGLHDGELLSFAGYVKEFSNIVFTKEVLFQLLFYILFTACIFPCSFIKNQRIWYLSMGSFFVVFSAFTLFMINCLPENTGKFSTMGNVVANFSTISSSNTILCIMGILAAIALPISYTASLKINSPKKFTT